MRIDVDYEHHPAFAPFIVEATAGPSFCQAIFEIDEAINSHVFGRDLQKEGITSVMERLRRGIDDGPVIESGLKPFILDAVSRAVIEPLTSRRDVQHGQSTSARLVGKPGIPNADQLPPGRQPRGFTLQQSPKHVSRCSASRR
jgi:hypothetical protein